MGAGLVTVSFIFFLLAKIIGKQTIAAPIPAPASDSSREPFWKSVWSLMRESRGTLFSGAAALALSLSISLLVLLVENMVPTTTNSYYQQLIAENATYLSFYALMILGAYFPFQPLGGMKLMSIWMASCYLVTWVQLISLPAFIFSLVGASGNILFGDEPCLKNELDSSVFNNPLLYSIAFVIIGLFSRLFVILSYIFKLLEKWFLLRSKRLSPGYAPTSSSWAALKLWAGDIETFSLLGGLPLVATEAMIIGVIYLFRTLFRPSLESSEATRAARIKFYNNISENMGTCFRKAKYLAWVLSILSLPLMWLEVAYILRLRNPMMLISGSAWIENQMGFGQILALLIWMPIPIVFTLTLSEFPMLMIFALLTPTNIYL
jgi:hypothetical protein